MQLPALKGIGGPEKMLCGSDYPFTPVSACSRMLDDFRMTGLLTEKQKVGALRTNALDLFPRFN